LEAYLATLGGIDPPDVSGRLIPSTWARIISPAASISGDLAPPGVFERPLSAFLRRFPMGRRSRRSRQRR
jgi:hypothetical protein